MLYKYTGRLIVLKPLLTGKLITSNNFGKTI